MEICEGGLGRSVAVALRFRILPERAPFIGEGRKIEATMQGERAQQNHRLVAVVGEIAGLLSRVIGSGRIGIAGDTAELFGDFPLAVDPMRTERQSVGDE